MLLSALNALPETAFAERLGEIFEHSPWIAAVAARQRPFADLDGLHRAMVAVVQAAGEDRQLALLRAHPDLAGKLARAGALTAASTAEQVSAGLDRLTDEEFERFSRLNRTYVDRFGFPFIIAVRENTKASILAAFERRLTHDRATEFSTALAEVAKIARFRLVALLAD